MTTETLPSRRAMLRAAFIAAAWPLASCAGHQHSGLTLFASRLRFVEADGFGRLVLRTGPENAPRVLLLHELPGLTEDDLTLAHLLGDSGFNVYVPLLFGAVGQDSVRKGFYQACHGEFHCSGLLRRAKVLDWLDTVVDRIAVGGSPVAVIGMCLTGILPLALLRPGVVAAVTCQPTLPFSTLRLKPAGAQKTDLGLGSEDLRRALASPVHFLAMRYQADGLCPVERMTKLASTFSPRVATIEVSGKGHSVLASSFDRDAFDDTVTYLRSRFRLLTSPQAMKVARLGGRACEITPDGQWRAV